MLARLGRFTYRRRRAVLIGSLLFVVASFAVAGGVASRLTTGGFADPNSESERAASILEHQFHAKDPNLVLLVTAKGGATVDDPVVAAAGRQLTSELAATRYLQQVASYWSLRNAPPLKSRGGHQALVLGVISGSDSQVADRIGAISDHFRRDGTAVRVAVGGRAEVNRQVNAQIQSDLPRAEGIAFPITLILLVVVFGSLVAAGLPLLVGVVAIAGSFLALYAISSITEVSVYSLNLTTAMGLGLAIDYSLFIVSRYREELRNGRGVEDAVVRTVQTAGRTVLGSALTVAVALGALMLFPLSFLRSFAYAGIAVSLLAAAGAVVALPALLSALGHRVDAVRIFRHRDPKPVGEGVWHRIAMLVMRRPIPIATAVIALLVILGLPFFNILFGLPDDRVLPAQVSSRQVQDDIRANFTSNEAAALQVAVPGLANPQAHTGEIAAYATAL
jgi:RND superfamily putative drug exporter